LALILGVCLALLSAITILPATWLEDAIPSLTVTGQDLLATAVIVDPGIRIAKRTPSQHLSVKEPERGTRISETMGAPSHRGSKQTRRIFWNLPRRQEYPARTKPISPDAPTDAFPA
jgi:hypothetical protein